MGGQKQKKISTFLALKEVAVAYKGGRLQEVPNIFDWKTFGILENWSLRRFDCIAIIYSKILFDLIIKKCTLCTEEESILHYLNYLHILNKKNGYETRPYHVRFCSLLALNDTKPAQWLFTSV